MNITDAMADVGLVGRGFDAQQQLTQDRAFQLEERRRQQEREAAADADFQRQQAFQQDSRNAIQPFLAGGSQSIPGDPGQTEIPAGTLDYSDTGEPRPAIAAKPSQTDLSGMYKALQDVALKHGQLDAFSTIKGNAEKLHDEGLLDFVKASKSGASPSALESIINAKGDMKVKPGSLQPVGDDAPGVYTAETTDGNQIRLDPDEITEGLLSPKDSIAHKDRQELNDVKTQAAQVAAQARQYGADQALQGKLAAIQATSSLVEARSQLAQAQAALAQAKSEGGGSRTTRTPGEWNAFDRELRAQATNQTMATDDSGRQVPDRKASVALSSMAAQLARDDPEQYPSAAQALAGAVEKMAEINKIKDGATDQATTEAKGLTFDTPKQQARWIDSRATGLTRAAQAPAATAGARTAPSPAPASTATPAPATVAPGTVAKPASQADFDALPSGSLYINPSDGQTYKKK